MQTPELGQVVIDPDEDAIDELERAVIRAVGREGPVHYSKRLQLKLLAASLLHPLGIHHWVRLRDYDRASDRIIETGNWVCGHGGCGAAKGGS